MRYVKGWWVPSDDTHYDTVLTQTGNSWEYQKEVRDKVIKLCRNRTVNLNKKSVAIDIGASLGMWAVPLSKWFDEIFCFEPVPKCYECLEKNMAYNDVKNFVLYRCAISSFDGHAKMRTPKFSGNCHILPTVEGEGDLTVPISMLDNYYNDLLEHRRVDLIKCDVEGTETHVFRGATKILQQHNPVIVVEQRAHSRKYGLDELSTVFFLEELGYRLVDKFGHDYILSR